ncbi:uncharacterized protein LOC143722670 [Siphateles boraxobius]|uniref:uncharacterized protein LOC143722670 n=1 Tax=Siphateles boraxobius TaxID=180520 RepID=UPI004062C740
MQLVEIRVKPGVCPSTDYVEVRCFMKGEELCADDSDCPNNEKCCSTACGGRQCTATVTVKPGVCPRTNYEVRCKRKGLVLCADDSECPKKEKCCSTACGGRQCTAPFTGYVPY